MRKFFPLSPQLGKDTIPPKYGFTTQNIPDLTLVQFKDTGREKASSNITPAFTKSMNMDIWVVGTSYQLFIRSSFTETKFSKK